MNPVACTILLCLCALPGQTIAQNKKNLDKKPLIIGETFTFHSAAIDEERTINVYLPEGYHQDSNEKYPVIYLLDGGLDEDFLHVAGLVQFASFPWVRYLKPSIVVGIVNVNRRRDFTFPSSREEDKKLIPAAGGSERFIRFLALEVLPAIKAHYRIDTPSVLIGQSAGGLLGSEILFTKPELFTHYILVSPSLWWDGQSLLARRLPVVSPRQVYIAVGKEGEEMEAPAAALSQKLQTNHHNVIFNFMEDADHGNILHLALYDAFRRMFFVPEEKE